MLDDLTESKIVAKIHLEDAVTARFTPLVELRAGRARPYIFIAPGGDRDVRDFAELANHIETKHAIYGMQARGLDGTEEPFDNVEDMAQCYMGAILELQPKGPYILLGHSMGGLLALEIAQRLFRIGAKVSLLVMLDTYPQKRYLTTWQGALLFLKLTRHHVIKSMKMPIREATTHLVAKSKDFLHSLTKGERAPTDQSTAGQASDSSRQWMRYAHRVAWRRYRPLAYTGSIKFVRGEHTFPHFPTDPAAVWARLVERIEVETLSKHDHYTMIIDPVSLASVLSRYLREALSDS